MVETTRRREIEDAASSLFHEHGYSGTSVRDIARAVDIQGASLYAHVASKQDVLWSIVERTASRFEAAADAVEAADPGALRLRSGRPPDLAGPRPRRGRHRRHRAGQRLRPRMALARPRPARRHRSAARRLRGPVPDGHRAAASRPARSSRSIPSLTAAYILTALNGLVAWYRPDGRLQRADDRRRLRRPRRSAPSRREEAAR